jgi:hypothetical protein
MGKRFCVVTLSAMAFCGSLWGQAAAATQPAALPPGPFSLGIAGNFHVPMADSAPCFGLGGGEEVNLGYQVPGTALVALGGLSYAITPGQFSAPTILIAAAEAGLGTRFPITSFLDLFAYGRGGIWYGTYYDMSTSSMNPCAGIGLELQLALSPTFALSLGAHYEIYFGLWQGLVAGLGMRAGFESR